MYNTINNEHDARNQKLNEELYLKYSLQEIDSDILVKKYQYASKSMKKIIHTIFKERGFNRSEIDHILMCAELAGDFHLGDSRQLTDKSLLPFDLVS